MGAQHKSRRLPAAANQYGQAGIIALLMIIGVGVTILVYNLATPVKLSIERDRKTAEALAQAKAALIGYAVSVDLTGTKRPGDLPCPDINDNGDAGGSCSNAGGTTLGRLPWKTLGLPDLRDGDGERLWYAVSSNFKNNPRTSCTAPGDAGCLNSDARGTITVRNKDGTVVNDGSNPNQYIPSGVIAVIIAPGRVLQRQGAASAQVRGCTVGVDCDADEKCTASPVTLTPKCNPVNYLDVFTGAFGTEDNVDFAETGNVTNGFVGSGTNGFIMGDIFDASGNLIVNDRVIVITYQDLMPLLERRVAKEAYNCMVSYAAASNGRYPWAASVTASASGDYASKQNERFGRIPDSFAETLVGVLSWPDAVVDLICPVTPAMCMSNSWPAPSASPACYIATGSWWLNWKEHVFYGVAQSYRPAATVVVLPPAVTVPAPTACDAALNYDCLVVTPPSSSDNKRFVVVVAGRALQTPMDPGGGPGGPAQQRGSAYLSNVANYLEHENGNNIGTSNVYSQQATSTTFNDVLLFLQ